MPTKTKPAVAAKQSAVPQTAFRLPADTLAELTELVRAERPGEYVSTNSAVALAIREAVARRKKSGK